MPALFAPENLILKQINGQKVRARDLLKYLQTYEMRLSDEALSEVESVLMATAEAANMILLNDCLNFYVNSMQEPLKKDDFFGENELLEIHQKTKTKSVARV